MRAAEVWLDFRSAVHGEVMEKSEKMAPYVDNAKDDVMKSAGSSSLRFTTLRRLQFRMKFVYRFR